MRAWPAVPGVPAAGHITASGHWHPGRIETCPKGTCPDDRKEDDRGAQPRLHPRPRRQAP